MQTFRMFSEIKNWQGTIVCSLKCNRTLAQSAVIDVDTEETTVIVSVSYSIILTELSFFYAFTSIVQSEVIAGFSKKHLL